MIEFQGKILKSYHDYVTGTDIVVFAPEQEALEACENLRDKRLTLNIKQYRQKRSLNANSYYWTLLSKICEATGRNSNYQHNLNLRECGYLEQDEDGNVISVDVADTEAGEHKADYAEHYHLYPTSNIYTRDGVTVRQYYLLRGSSTFNTKEMARLIDIAVDQAKDLGIETATPEQINEYLQRWGVNIGEKRDDC